MSAGLTLPRAVFELCGPAELRGPTNMSAGSTFSRSVLLSARADKHVRPTSPRAVAELRERAVRRAGPPVLLAERDGDARVMGGDVHGARWRATSQRVIFSLEDPPMDKFTRFVFVMLAQLALAACGSASAEPATTPKPHQEAVAAGDCGATCEITNDPCGSCAISCPVGKAARCKRSASPPLPPPPGVLGRGRALMPL